MNKELLQYILVNDFYPMKGSWLSCQIPITQKTINFFLKDLSSQSDYIESIELVEIQDEVASIKISIFPIDIGLTEFDFDKVIKCKVLDLLKPPDFVLALKIVDGINFIEAKLLKVFINTIVATDGLEFDGKTFSVNHKKLTKIGDYDYLTKKMANVKLETVGEKLFYKFDLQF